MKVASNEIQKSLKELYTILDEYPDSPKVTYDFVTFIKSFLKIKSDEPLPTIEVMTLIKHKKPIIFSNLKRMAANNDLLKLLTELSMDIDLAKERLDNILN